MIPYLCCIYHYSGARIKRKTDELCRKKGIRDAESYLFANMLDGILSESIDLMCGKYSSVASCEKELADAIPRLKAIVDANTLPTINHSMIVAMDNLVRQLDHELQ